MEKNLHLKALNGLKNWLYFKLLNAVPDTNTHPGTDAGANYY